MYIYECIYYNSQKKTIVVMKETEVMKQFSVGCS